MEPTDPRPPPLKTYICGCVRNCATYIPAVIANIQTLALLFDDYHIVVAYDNSTDQSLRRLCDAKRSLPSMDILLNNSRQLTPIRTQNIAYARNAILDFIRSDRPVNRPDFNYFIMIDFDDVCAGVFDTMPLYRYLQRERDGNPCPWDSLSFHRPKYYDVWALSIHPFMYSCWHFPDSRTVVTTMRNYIETSLNKLANTSNDGCELLSCASAFNGFALYRIDKFIDISYEWNADKSRALLTPEQIHLMEAVVGQSMGQRHDHSDCEHRYFHFQATRQHGARICISPYVLFPDIVTSH